MKLIARGVISDVKVTTPGRERASVTAPGDSFECEDHVGLRLLTLNQATKPEAKTPTKAKGKKTPTKAKGKK